MTVAYASVADYNVWIKLPDRQGQARTQRDSLINEILMASSRVVDDITNQWFHSVERTVLRQGTFGNQNPILILPPIISITSIHIDNVLLDPSKYEILPAEEPDLQPYRLLRTDGLGWPSRAIIKIIGMFGWSTIPENVKIATMLITSKTNTRPATPGGVDASGLYVPRYDPDVTKYLTRYCRGKGS